MSEPIHCECCEGQSLEYVDGRAVAMSKCPGVPDQSALVARLAAALAPFAENPANQTNYHCHTGIASADDCGRCSRAAEAYRALAAVPPDLREGRKT